MSLIILALNWYASVKYSGYSLESFDVHGFYILLPRLGELIIIYPSLQNTDCNLDTVLTFKSFSDQPSVTTLVTLCY